MKELSRFQIGCIGEMWVMFQLSLRGIFSQKQNILFDYDLLTNNNIQIKVKTSTIHNETPGPNSSEDYKREYWLFANQEGRKRNCNFYCFVGLDENLQPEKTFIIPADLIGEREMISIPRNLKRDALIYGGKSINYFMNKFELITDL